MPLYCGKCGTKILEDHRFCWKCGAKVELPVSSGPAEGKRSVSAANESAGAGVVARDEASAAKPAAAATTVKEPAGSARSSPARSRTSKESAKGAGRQLDAGNAPSSSEPLKASLSEEQYRLVVKELNRWLDISS